jgi:hypothetical protein
MGLSGWVVICESAKLDLAKITSVPSLAIAEGTTAMASAALVVEIAGSN